MTNVTKDIYYVGVNDHQIDLFEAQYDVPLGMAYNSYVIVDDKTAVMDTIEINEAFASQSLACIRDLGMPMEKVNPYGGAMALGHPLGCTGAILVGKAIDRLREVDGKYALITMCIGGGMGAAGILERCDEDR